MPAFGRRVSVWVNGHLAWNGSRGLADGARLRDGSVYLSGLAGGTYQIDSRGQAAAPPVSRPALTVSASPSLPRPGQATQVTATVTNPGRSCLSGVTVGIQPPPAPAGWTVAPGGQADVGTVGAGSSASATFTVMLPSTGLSGSIQEMLATATYTGCARGSRPETLYGRASVQVLYPSLSAAFDNVAVSDDSDTSTASVDGNGDSFSAQALAALGVTPGAQLSYDGIGFTWPSASAGQPDNTVAAGQTFALSGSGTSLGLLDTGTFGPVDGTGTINYADGSTQSFTISVPDWYRTAPAGSNPVIVLPYRNTPPGHHGGNATGQDYTPNNIYEQTIPLEAGRQVASVTLPATSSDSAGSPSLHVFAIGIAGS